MTRVALAVVFALALAGVGKHVVTSVRTMTEVREAAVMAAMGEGGEPAVCTLKD